MGGKTLYLCLNGKTLSSNGTAKIQVKNGGRLVLCDCQGGGTFKGATKSVWGGACVYLYTSRLDMFGGKLTGGKVTGKGGGAIALDDPQCAFNMYGGEISGNDGRNYGGAIFQNFAANKPNATGGNFNMYGGVIRNNTAKNGGAFFSTTGGTINMTGGTISGNKATQNSNDAGGGAIYMRGNGTINITGSAQITGNSSSRDGGAILMGWGTINITGSAKINNNTANRWGGAICLRQDSNQSTTLYMRGGEISGNKANSEGGAVHVLDKDCQFFLYDGKITGNTSGDGGAIYLNQEPSWLIMQGGEISGNTATGNGGGVYIYRSGSVCEFYGGKIENNKAGGNGGGIYINPSNSGQLKVGNTAVAQGNTVSGKANNVYLPSGKTLSIGIGMSTGSSVGVTIENTSYPVAFSNAYGRNYATCFFADDANAYVEYKDDQKLYLVAGTEYTLTFDANGGTGGTNRFVIPNTIPTRDNAHFGGWALTAGADSPQYQPGDTVTIDGGMKMTLYAYWKAHGDGNGDGFCDGGEECLHGKDADGYCTVSGCTHNADGHDCCPIEDTRIVIERDTQWQIGIGKTYNGTTQGELHSIYYTDGTNQITLTDEEGRANCTIAAVYDTPDAGRGKTVTVTVTLTEEAAKQYKFKNGTAVDTFTTTGYIDKAVSHPTLSIPEDQRQLMTTDTLFPRLSIAGVMENAPVTYYYAEAPFMTVSDEYDRANTEITGDTVISEPGRYWVYAVTGETANYQAGRTAAIEITVHATPTLTPPTVAGTFYAFDEYGMVVKALTGGTATVNGAPVEGTFSFDKDELLYGFPPFDDSSLNAGELTRRVIFTPTDERYTTTACTVTVNILPLKVCRVTSLFFDITDKDIGTSFEGLNLQKQISFTTLRGTVELPSHYSDTVIWDESTYDPNNPYEQTITGTLKIVTWKGNIEQPAEPVTVSVKVRLNRKQDIPTIVTPPVFRWSKGDYQLGDNQIFAGDYLDVRVRPVQGEATEISKLVGGEAGFDGKKVDGTFSLKKASWIRGVGMHDAVVIFTPTDTTLYAPVEYTIQIEAIKRTAARIEPWLDITDCEVGTAFADLHLPSHTAFHTEDGSYYPNVPVTWGETAYDPDSTAEQTITGTLDLKYYLDTVQQPEPELKDTIKVRLIPHDWSDWTPDGNGTHSRTCKRDAAHKETVNCSGGTATCQEKAVCAICGQAYGQLAAHDFTAEAVEEKYQKSAATCTEKAAYYKSCTVCGEKGTETFEVGNILGHDWGEWQSNGNGTHSRVCARDNSHKETKDCSGGTATCQAKAVCSVCRHEYGQLGTHSFTAETVEEQYLKSAATCTEKAVYYKSCATCGLSAKDTAEEAVFETKALGHDWGKWQSNGDGTHTHVCTRDDTHKETVSCSGGIATCVEQATCKDCGGKYGEKDAANHIGTKEWTTTKTTHEQKWSCCGGIAVAKEAHTFGKWVVTKKATFRKDGEKTRTCEVCDYVETAKIPATGTSPKTGDDSHIGMWAGILCVSLAGIVALIVWYKRKNRK